ncbi:MAG: hypothetical protein QXG10_05410 [Candidatus Hadarchaeales archaeon]
MKRSPRKMRAALNYIRRGSVLFLVLLGLTLIVHETAHLLMARFLGYQANVFYGMHLFNVYGYVTVEPPVTNPLHAALIYSIGGLAAGLVMLLLWSSIEDVLARVVFSFFIAYQFSYGLLEPLYGFRMVERSALDAVPLLFGSIVFLMFLTMYPKVAAGRRKGIGAMWSAEECGVEHGSYFTAAVQSMLKT